MNEPNPKYNDYGPIDIGGRRPKGGYAVVALDPESGVGQDGDYVQRYRDAVAWARQMARGEGVYRGGGLIESSAIVYADFGPSEERVTLYSISPPGFPVWKEEQRGRPVELNPPKGPMRRWQGMRGSSAYIIEAMARALWVMAYADWVERMSKAERKEHGDVPVSLQGLDWDEDAPGTPAAAEQAARELAELYEAENGVSLDVLWDRALTADGITDPDERIGADWFAFGRYLAHMAVGSGISWFDDHAQFELKGVSAFECSFDGEHLDWSGRIEKTYNPGKSKSPTPGDLHRQQAAPPLLQRWRARHARWHVGDAVSFLDDEGKRRKGEVVKVTKNQLVIDDGEFEWGIDPQHVTALKGNPPDPDGEDLKELVEHILLLQESQNELAEPGDPLMTFEDAAWAAMDNLHDDGPREYFSGRRISRLTEAQIEQLAKRAIRENK